MYELINYETKLCNGRREAIVPRIQEEEEKCIFQIIERDARAVLRDF